MTDPLVEEPVSELVRLQNEIVRFLVILGILMAVGAVLTWNSLADSTPIGGMPRGSFFALILGGFAFLHVVPALVYWRSGRMLILVVAVAANTLLSILSLVSFGFMGLVGGAMQVLMPILVWNRFLKIRSELAQPSEGDAS